MEGGKMAPRHKIAHVLNSTDLYSVKSFRFYDVYSTIKGGKYPFFSILFCLIPGFLTSYFFICLVCLCSPIYFSLSKSLCFRYLSCIQYIRSICFMSQIECFSPSTWVKPILIYWYDWCLVFSVAKYLYVFCYNH